MSVEHRSRDGERDRGGQQRGEHDHCQPRREHDAGAHVGQDQAPVTGVCVEHDEQPGKGGERGNADRWHWGRVQVRGISISVTRRPPSFSTTRVDPSSAVPMVLPSSAPLPG